MMTAPMAIVEIKVKILQTAICPSLGSAMMRAMKRVINAASHAIRVSMENPVLEVNPPKITSSTVAGLIVGRGMSEKRTMDSSWWRVVR